MFALPILPGAGGVAPPIRTASPVVWCGLRQPQWMVWRQLSRCAVDARDPIDSSAPSGGRIVRIRLAGIVFPETEYIPLASSDNTAAGRVLNRNEPTSTCNAAAPRLSFVLSGPDEWHGSSAPLVFRSARKAKESVFSWTRCPMACRVSSSDVLSMAGHESKGSIGLRSPATQ